MLGTLPSSIQTLLAIWLGIVPGAIYYWVKEWSEGRNWEIESPDRLLKFAAVSAVIFFASVPLHLLAYHVNESMKWVHGSTTTGDVAVLWGYILLWSGLVALFAWRYGTWKSHRDPSKQKFPDPWDRLFVPLYEKTAHGYLQVGPHYILRVRMLDGRWIGGRFDADSQVSTSIGEKRELVLENEIDVDPNNGEFRTDEDGNLIVLDNKVWVDVTKADQVIADNL